MRPLYRRLIAIAALPMISTMVLADTLGTATDLLLGVGYGVARGNTLNTTFKVNASGRSGTELRANWLYTF